MGDNASKLCCDNKNALAFLVALAMSKYSLKAYARFCGKLIKDSMVESTKKLPVPRESKLSQRLQCSLVFLFTI